jgi:ParB family chromosome partitioning protein
MAKKKPVYAEWPLAKLREHPRQAALFRDLPPDELAEIAKSMEERGLDHEVEVLPDGTVVGGHQRVRAAKKLGWKKIKVRVRHDLAAAGPDAAVQFLVEDNLLRRQLSPLDKARSIKELAEVELRRQGKKYRPSKQELEKLLGERLNLHTKSIQRYMHILETPPEVQQAFDRGELPIIPASRVASLWKEKQAEIACRIGAGEIPKKVVADYLDQKESHRHCMIENALEGLRRSLVRGIHDLKDRLDELDENRVTEKLKAIWPDMEEGLALIQTLRSHVDVEAAKRAAARPRKSMEEHVADLIKFRNRGDQESEHNAAAHDEEE